MNLDKINFSALAMMLLVGLFLALSSCEQTEPQGFLQTFRRIVKTWQLSRHGYSLLM
jgi:hypothetical protein